jgi:hypothetical protein
LDRFFAYASKGERERKYAVKPKLFPLSLVVFTLFAFSVVSTRSQTVVTFDDLNETASGSFLTAPYQGLVWSNFGCLNAILDTAEFGPDGTYYGMVSASNVAVNGGGQAAEIGSPVTNFNFLSVYLTGEHYSNLNIEVQGFSGTTMLYDTTVVASGTSPTLFTFDYQNVNRLYFNSFGGQPILFGGYESFVMDNFTFEFVPEPSSLLLAALGGLSLIAFLRRKRT